MRSDLIFDIGLHQGEDSEFYLKKGFNVVAVEASAANCDLARSRLARYCESGQLTILNVAIAATAGPVTFYVNDDVSVWGTTSKQWAERNAARGTTSRSVTVEGVEFGSILERYGVPYYMKVDIEGADLLCIQALRRAATRPKFVSLESSKTSWNDLCAEFDLLEDLGFSKFKVVNQKRVPMQKCPRPAREGESIEHTFPRGASGLFGEEAPGAWRSRREALRRYRAIFLRYRLLGDSAVLSGLQGSVARLPVLWRFADHLSAGWYDTHAGR